MIVWSFIEPRILVTDTEIAKIPNLPTAWQNQQVGQISDFQIGLWGDNRGTARRSVARLVEARPAVVLITGDFIYHPGSNLQEDIETAVAIVRPLVEAEIPTYAVLGNHDYRMKSQSASPDVESADRLKTALNSIGVEVLENEVVRLKLHDRNDSLKSEYLNLVGIGSLWANRDKVRQALRDLPTSEPRIVMMHNPDSFEKFPAESAPFAVAGHTHGGQVRVPGTPHLSWLKLARQDKVHADGWAKDYGRSGNHLYVNSGIGMSIVPIRLFCPPKLTLFTLKKS
ncbi:RNA-directed DNA polymerase [Geitlerinema sp. FC II]|nr:RNA-directed DNA polymerase [Geitlerinema sp. FC II]